MAKIGITGGTGFIGSRLAQLLLQEGYEVVIFSRTPRQEQRTHFRYAHWDPGIGTIDVSALQSLDAMVHLSGAGIADKRWTRKRKQELISSRVDSTRFLIDQLRNHATSCRTFIAASAIGYYGSDTADSSSFNEECTPADDFLGRLCKDWEAASRSASDFARVAICRFGIVLGKGSGAYPSFAAPLRWGIAPVLGKGNQIISWIHVHDLTHILLHLLRQPVSGIFNAVAPHPITQKQLIQTIGTIKGDRYITIPIPAFLLNIGLGALASELLKSCTVSCAKIQETGFQFRHPHLSQAISQIVSE